MDCTTRKIRGITVGRSKKVNLFMWFQGRVSHRCCKHGGAPQSLMGEGGLKSKHGGNMGGGGSLKCCRKIPVKEFI